MRSLTSLLLVITLLSVSCAKQDTAKNETPPPPPPPPFELLTATQTDAAPIIVKVNKKTGEAWYRASADDEYQWRKIHDPAPPPPSDYEFSIVVNRDSWNLVRLDVHSGRGWGTEPGSWKEYGAAANVP